MIYDTFDNLILTQIMKYQKNDCPLTQVTQNKIGCTCSFNDICSGFCTFPVDGIGKMNLVHKTIRYTK